MLPGRARIGLRSARAGESRLDAADEARLVRSFLRSQLGNALPVTERKGDEARVLFHGQRQSIRFVGRVPAHRGGGGIQLLELRAEIQSGSPKLVFYYRDAWPDVPFDARVDAAWERRELVESPETVRFRFFGSPDDQSPPGWRDEWSGSDRLPQLIEVGVAQSDARHWPPLIAAVRTPSAAGQMRLFREANLLE